MTATGGRLPLRQNRPLQLYLASRLVSTVGDQIAGLALPWLVYNITGSALAMGTLYAVLQLPVLLSPFVGTVADRLDRRAMLLAADLGRAGLTALTVLLWYTGTLQIWHLYLLGALSAALSRLYQVVNFAIIPVVVPPAEVPALNSLSLALQAAGFMVGPVLGGALIAAVGAPAALLVDAVTFVLPALSLLWFRPPTPERNLTAAGRTAFLKETWVGVRFYFSHPILRSIGAYMSLSNLGTSIFLSQMLVFLRETFQFGPTTIGLLYFAFALTHTIGFIITPHLMRRVNWSAIMAVCGLSTGLFIMVYAQSHSFWALVITSAAFGLVFGPPTTVSSTIRQRVMPQTIIGRVQSVHELVCFGFTPMGAFVAGLITTYANIRVTMMVAGTVLLLRVLVVIFTPLGRLGRGEQVSGHN